MSGYAYMWAKRQIVGDSTTKTVLKTYAHWAAEDYSTWVSNKELVLDTELDVKTIRKCRERLIGLGYLVETQRRAGETRSIIVYQMLAPEGSPIVQVTDQRTGETIILSPPTLEQYEAKLLQKRSPSKNGRGSRKNDQSQSKNGPAPKTEGLRGAENGAPPKTEPLQIRPEAPPNLDPSPSKFGPLVNVVKKEIGSSSNAGEEAPVDNSTSLPLLLEDEKAKEPSEPADDIAPPNAEAGLLAVLAKSPTTCAIDPKTDRVHVLTWVGKGATPAQLADALDRAMVRRKRDGDDRPVYAKFLDRFVTEVLAGVAAADEPTSDVADEHWWLSDSGTGAQGKRVRVERRPNETTPDYLIRVAKESGRGPWIEFVLKRWQGSARYQQIVDFFGAEILPVDFYA
ncbi:hypothetical protein ACLKMY_00585 [Paraburkholderia mimosarum]|uniref:hypothetical protein n=1 Tax=Paraburkholderia mimosarum TaxID=312026 RepID=UPI0039C3B05E